jgi:hypothetical protein
MIGGENTTGTESLGGVRPTSPLPTTGEEKSIFILVGADTNPWGENSRTVKFPPLPVWAAALILANRDITVKTAGQYIFPRNRFIFPQNIVNSAS